jgi:hypothetical protein
MVNKTRYDASFDQNRQAFDKVPHVLSLFHKNALSKGDEIQAKNHQAACRASNGVSDNHRVLDFLRFDRIIAIGSNGFSGTRRIGATAAGGNRYRNIFDVAAVSVSASF